MNGLPVSPKLERMRMNTGPGSTGSGFGVDEYVIDITIRFSPNNLIIEKCVLHNIVVFYYMLFTSAEEHISLLFDLCRGDDGKASIKVFFEVNDNILF